MKHFSETASSQLGTARANRLFRAVRDLPGRTTLTYAVIASAWIVCSDAVVALASDDVGLGHFLVNVGKGIGFVAITAVVLYAVLRSWRDRLEVGLGDLELQRRRFGHLVEATDDIVGVFDDHGRLTYVSPSVETVLGWAVGDALGEQGRAFVHPDDREAAIEHLAKTRARVAPVSPEVFRLLTQTGEWRHVEILASDLRDEPSVGGVVVHGRDITDRVHAELRLAHALAHDPVTGLANRATYEEQLAEAALGLQFRGHQLGVLVLDVLEFRSVNEFVGRRGGDEVLRTVVERMQTCLDPVAIGRIGADEFSAAVSLSVEDDGDPMSDLTDRCHRLLELIATPLTVDGRRIDVACEIGATVAVPPFRVGEILVTAENTLQEAKGHPDQLAVVRHERSRRARQGRPQPSELHEALENHELELHYQPQRELATGDVVGCEALLRWNHPNDGVLGPAHFLEEGTRGSLLPLVTRFVLGEASRQAAIWESEGRDISVSVNLSLGDLRRRTLVDDVLAAVDAAGIDPSRLVLELTEHSLLAEPNESLRTMQVLREKGVGFSIDDFGTGFSSLAHLRLLTVDELKIDPTFVAAMRTSPIDDSIISAVIDLGHRSELTIVAEGIEDMATCELLAERGCHRGQGYLLGRPVSADEVEFSRFEPERGSRG